MLRSNHIQARLNEVRQGHKGKSPHLSRGIFIEAEAGAVNPNATPFWADGDTRAPKALIGCFQDGNAHLCVNIIQYL